MGVSKITIIGAGLMGHGIAHAGAIGGYRVVLNDLDQGVLQKALSKIEGSLQKGVKLGKISLEQMGDALRNITLETNLREAAQEADLVIEAVSEELDLKLKIFKNLAEICRIDTVLATNTSAKSVTEIASVTGTPGRVIGMHFFNPVHAMKLVEIVRGLETSDETYRIAEEVAKKMGKETVEAKEAPGFITSRINGLIRNEAFYMLQEGVATARDIDKALKLGLNHPMGPFELSDLVGLDTALSSMQYLHQALGDKFRPCPLLVKYVKAGRLGKKVGKGVYDYGE